MRNEKFSGLRRRVWFYFLPVLAVILTVGAYIICNAENGVSRYGMILAVLSAIVSLMAIPFLLISNIVVPLEEVLKAAGKIQSGYLNETVPIRKRDEIGKIGEQINALSVNLQEILLHVWNHSRQSAGFVERIAYNIRSGDSGRIPPHIERDIEAVRYSMKEMQQLVKTFEYYDIRMDEEKLVSAEAFQESGTEKEKIS